MLTLLPTPTFPAVPPESMVAVASFDHAAAAREGWALVDCGLSFDGASQAQLQRLEPAPDGRPAFAEDHDAWAHVVARARTGSRLHQAALAAVDDVERMLIEAIASGDPPAKQTVA